MTFQFIHENLPDYSQVHSFWNNFVIKQMEFPLLLETLFIIIGVIYLCLPGDKTIRREI